jgi:hypothetical protein
MPDIRERLMTLAALAASEQDPKKLIEYLCQMNELMDIEDRERLELAKQIDGLKYIELLDRLEAANQIDPP